MGAMDQFKDKAQNLADQAKSKLGGAQDEASERASAKDAARDQAEREAQEAQDRFDQDYDA